MYGYCRRQNDIFYGRSVHTFIESLEEKLCEMRCSMAQKHHKTIETTVYFVYVLISGLLLGD